VDEQEQGQNNGLSKSEKAALIRAVVTGLAASVATVWPGAISLAGGITTLLGICAILSCLLAFAVAASMIITAESWIEDSVKLLLFGMIWLTVHFFAPSHAFESITLGLLIGSVTGFLGNRLSKKR